MIQNCKPDQVCDQKVSFQLQKPAKQETLVESDQLATTPDV